MSYQNIVSTIDKYIEKLNSFSTSDELAQFLKDEHAKGYKGDSDSCVITNWLEDKTDLDVATDDEIRFYSPYGVSDVELLSVAEISPVVKNFIEEFDNGKHPELDYEYWAEASED